MSKQFETVYGFGSRITLDKDIDPGPPPQTPIGGRVSRSPSAVIPRASSQIVSDIKGAYTRAGYGIHSKMLNHPNLVNTLVRAVEFFKANPQVNPSGMVRFICKEMARDFNGKFPYPPQVFSPKTLNVRLGAYLAASPAHTPCNTLVQSEFWLRYRSYKLKFNSWVSKRREACRIQRERDTDRRRGERHLPVDPGVAERRRTQELRESISREIEARAYIRSVYAKAAAIGHAHKIFSSEEVDEQIESGRFTIAEYVKAQGEL